MNIVENQVHLKKNKIKKKTKTEINFIFTIDASNQYHADNSNKTENIQIR
jgi:hypothetical protein